MKLALLAIPLFLTACQTPAQSERLGSLVSLAISIAESRGVITAQDAADIRAAETIILPPTQVETTSGK